MSIPGDIERQVREILSREDLTEAEARAQYPEVIRWFNDNISLADLMRDSGIDLRPISPDAPGILVGAGCPTCAGRVAVT